MKLLITLLVTFVIVPAAAWAVQSPDEDSDGASVADPTICKKCVKDMNARAVPLKSPSAVMAEADGIFDPNKTANPPSNSDVSH